MIMNIARKYHLIIIVSVLLNFGLFYLAYVANLDSSNKISKLEHSLSLYETQISELEMEISVKNDLINSLQGNMNIILNELYVGNESILDLNNTVEYQRDLIITYVNNLVQELYNSAEDKIYYIIEINELKNRIDELELLLNSTE